MDGPRFAVCQFALAWFVLTAVSIVSGFVTSAARGQQPESSVKIDSFGSPAKTIDSLIREDSIRQAVDREEWRKLARTKQLATQREIDLTGDGKPEVLRLSGYLAPMVDSTKMTFTIKSGNKLLFEDSWLASGVFDPIDHLLDSVKLWRLRRFVLVYFANENFELVDSAEFENIMQKVSPADIAPHSRDAEELFKAPRLMYSVFHSRDYWYGLVWDPKKQKFVKVWKN